MEKCSLMHFNAFKYLKNIFEIHMQYSEGLQISMCSQKLCNILNNRKLEGS